MPFVDLQLPAGLQRNATPYDTPNRWWDVNMVRWQAGAMRPVGGWQRTTSTPFDSLARGMLVYRDNTDIRHILVGTDAKLYAEDGGSFVDVTPTGFTPLTEIGSADGYGTGTYGTETYGTARSTPSAIFAAPAFWSMSNWGQDVILTANSDGKLYYYSSLTAAVAPVEITTAPSSNTAVVVTDERHVMVIGCDGQPRQIAWCSREDYEDWNFASTTNTAGFIDLDTRTPLTKGVKVREGVLIFSQSEAYLARYVGQPFIYTADRIADTTLQSPQSVAVYNGKAAWMGKNGFWRYEGGFIVPLACPISNDIFGNIDPGYGPYRCHACHNGTYPEIWFFYPSVGSSECDRFAIWNYFEDWWSWGELSRSAMAPGEAHKYPFMGGVDKNLYEHENGWTDAGLSRIGTIYAESGMLPLTRGDFGVFVTQALPANDFGASSTELHFYSRQTPEGAERQFGPYVPRSDGYTDCRVSGRDVRVRIHARSDDNWSIGKMRFNVEKGTGR